MVTAMNFVVFDKSFQAASLGDASLIAIVATIQVLLHAVEELFRRIERNDVAQMVTSNASEEVSYQFAMNMATYLNMPIEWIIHCFWNSMNY